MLKEMAGEQGLSKQWGIEPAAVKRLLAGLAGAGGPIPPPPSLSIERDACKPVVADEEVSELGNNWGLAPSSLRGSTFRSEADLAIRKILPRKVCRE